MPEPERSVIHLLPHPGGGGETYVDVLAEMPGYRFSRIHLAPDPTPSVARLARGVVRAYRHAWGHDLLHVHGDAASGLCLPLLATRPSVVTLHGLHLLRRLEGPARTVVSLGVRAVTRAADKTICVSQAEHDQLTAAISPATARGTVVVHNGVRIPPPVGEAERTAVRRELGLAASAPLGIWVGSLDERKDPLAAIRAAEAASVDLLVVGDGPLRAEAERTAGERVVVLGRRRDVPRLLAASDFYVMTSHREGLALSVLEAMAHGLAPVVTDLPENVEAVGEAGVVVPESDQEALVAALRRLVEHEAERRALGDLARERVAEHFGADAMIARTRAVYDEVLAG